MTPTQKLNFRAVLRAVRDKSKADRLKLYAAYRGFPAILGLNTMPSVLEVCLHERPTRLQTLREVIAEEVRADADALARAAVEGLRADAHWHGTWIKF